MNKEERALRNLLRVWTVLFGIGTLVFLTAGNLMLDLINRLSSIVTPSLPPIPLSLEKFWLVLTTSLMLTLTTLSFYIQRDVKSRAPLTLFLLISKFTSTFFFTLFFITERSLAYLIGGLFCDGPIFLITLIFYRRLCKCIP